MFWMDIKGGLRTKDKLMNWGVLSSPISSVRHQEIDTLSHLFFSCPYSREGWKQVWDLCGISKANQSWDAKINWLIRKFSWKSVHSIVRKIAWEAIIYSIWLGRNCRVFQGIQRHPTAALHRIRSAVRIKGSQVKNVNPHPLVMLYVSLGKPLSNVLLILRQMRRIELCNWMHAFLVFGLLFFL